MDSDKHTRSTCGVLDLRQQRVRRSGWQWRWSAAAGVDGLLVPIDRRRKIRRRAGDDGVGPNAPRRDQHDTRRHPATSVSFWDGDRRLRSVSLAP